MSIKLSALHPRYVRAQAGRVMAELYPRLLTLATMARGHDIGLNIDAEEHDRLDLSLDRTLQSGHWAWGGAGIGRWADLRYGVLQATLMIDLDGSAPLPPAITSRRRSEIIR